jgi:hypothetical protein
MSWRVSVGFAVTISVAALSFSAIPVRADEAYLCGPDKVVYVAVEDLEMRKRTDPCIAAYYGLKVEAAAAVEVTPVAATAPEKLTKTALSKTTVAGLKPLSDAEIPDRVSKRTERQASLDPPRPTPGTDYRNIKILNAASTDDAWYRHTK